MLRFVLIRFDKHIRVVWQCRPPVFVVSTMRRATTCQKQIAPVERQFRIVIPVLASKMFNMPFVKNTRLAICASDAILGGFFCGNTRDAL
ncbi:hypothetical protein V476_01880 [Pseudomonas syringae KCTC 12500]|nr:hypothetical protein V476_01880 [Pseudomonas syringae KCTC 12500]POR84216.1 hypothetical protein BKM21_19560 [Pseudomonas syringae pv. syringae]